MRVVEYMRGWRALNRVLRVKQGSGGQFRGFSQMTSACDQPLLPPVSALTECLQV